MNLDYIKALLDLHADDGAITQADDGATMQPSVVIFGAGITGLTAAHELVERGWNVTVVEKEIDPLDVDECSIGGLAKTQWSVYQPPQRPTREPTEALPLVPTVRLRAASPIGDLLDDSAKANLRNDTTLDDAQKWLPKKELEYKLRAVLDQGSLIYRDRIAARLEAIKPFSPKLTISRGTMAPEDLAQCLRLYLMYHGADHVTIPSAPNETLPSPVLQIETDLTDRSLLNVPGNRAGILPGEHGFRFFPALYRHVFDTLRRIPVRGEGQSFGDVYRTVYDNLIPTESNWLTVDDPELRPGSEAARKHDVVRFPRRLRKSLRELFDSMNEMQTELCYTPRDIQLLELRLFKYMTSCRRRRNEQYEYMSWSDFMGLSDLSPACQQDMERAPQLLAAMTAKQSDARTQGNLATQLMLDPINADDRVDSTLNAPTTVAWFAHWKDYLVSQGVSFIPGALTGFSAQEQNIRPSVRGSTPSEQIPSSVSNADYYLLALPIQAWSEGSLIDSWKREKSGIPGAINDHLDRLGAWVEMYVKSKDRPLYKGLTGIQFYFDSDELPRSGHTLYMDSPWRLCAISQASFWNRRRESFDCYRGIVSVDIGSFEDPVNDKHTKPFWLTVKREVHSTVWRQIDRRHTTSGLATRPGAIHDGSNQSRLPYRMYRIDEYIKYPGCDGTPNGNHAPFLINGIDEWDFRAGWDTPHKDENPREEPPSFPAEERSEARYQLMPRSAHDQPPGNVRWVLAGTFMQTWTRATTMESANESARHAVNTLVRDARKKFGIEAELCRIWNPEEYEHPDLRIWQELDEKLYEFSEPDHLPHMFDILELDAIPEMLMETGDLTTIIDKLANIDAKRRTRT